MGYSHYWDAEDDVRSDAWGEFRRIASIVIDLADVPLEDESTSDQIWLNGVGPEDDYETFALGIKTRTGFCKTGFSRFDKRPYDVVVVAMLEVAKQTGVIKDWHSDGDAPDLEDGIALAMEAMEAI